MKRRSRAGGEPVKERRRKARNAKAPQCAKGHTTFQFVPYHAED